jgi:Fur family ferric uptake transcriptional regulator
MDNNKIVETVNLMFAEYLKENKFRRTPERFAILNAIYSINGGFEIEQLLSHLEQEEKFRVSRATVYNTIDLLMECGLLRKHQFNSQPAQYEVALGSHFHLVCTQCGKVKEVEADEVISQVMSRRYTAFTPAYVSAYLYGLCSSCIRQNKKKIKPTK